MKRILIAATIVAGMSNASAQLTITSVASGNANNPFVWDCTCFPTTDDHIIINHAIVMNVDWLVNAGGSITVNASGSFIEDAMNRSILVDGVGSQFVNYSSTELTGMAFTNGASGTNTSNLTLDTALFIDGSSSFNNTGTIHSLDSLLNNGTFINGSLGYMPLGDLWNNGTFTNDGTLSSDSLLNTNTFISTGLLSCIDFGNTGPFSQTADFNVANNFYNAGDITFGSNTTVLVGNDMLTGDTLGGSASITNNGAVGVGNDFINTDVLDGSGRYCITNSSLNSGAVSGTLDICDQSPGGGFDTNIGSIGASVTFCSSICDVGVAELAMNELLLYPNPTNDFFTVELAKGSANHLSLELYDIAGNMMIAKELTQTTSTIEISSLSNGIYICKILSNDRVIDTTRVVKN